MTTEMEFPCEWNCPNCATFQRDSVNPQLGPFVTCTCTSCGQSFDDSRLDAVSLASWESARQKAEDQELIDRAKAFGWQWDEGGPHWFRNAPGASAFEPYQYAKTAEEAVAVSE